MPGPLIVPMPSQQTVMGRPRKESIYDTEVYPGPAAAVRTQVDCFVSLGAFAVAPIGGLTKVFGRDSNLRGTNTGGLPNAAWFYWYGWRCPWSTLNANLNTDANAPAFEQLHRLMALTYVEFNFQAGKLMTQKASDLPSGTGPQFVATTRTTQTLLSLPNCVPDRRYKDMLVMGRPIELTPGEQFVISLFTPQGSFSPIVDFFVSPTLDGIFVRGMS